MVYGVRINKSIETEVSTRARLVGKWHDRIKRKLKGRQPQKNSTKKTSRLLWREPTVHNENFFVNKASVKGAKTSICTLFHGRCPLNFIKRKYCSRLFYLSISRAFLPKLSGTLLLKSAAANIKKKNYSRSSAIVSSHTFTKDADYDPYRAEFVDPIAHFDLSPH